MVNPFSLTFFEQQMLVWQRQGQMWVRIFLARPLKLAAMTDLRSGVYSQTQEILHFPVVSEIVFFKKPHN